MADELMSCLTCLRVQLASDMLLVENPARDRASMASFRICMGCASAISAALTAKGIAEHVRPRETATTQNDDTARPASSAGDPDGRGSGNSQSTAKELSTASEAELVEVATSGLPASVRKRK
jgi:hypothetical protein